MEEEHLTQEQKVIDHIRLYGEVDNFWAIQNYILRLGAIIHSLKRKGYEFTGRFGKDRGYEKKYWKNYYYIVKKEQTTLL